MIQPQSLVVYPIGSMGFDRLVNELGETPGGAKLHDDIWPLVGEPISPSMELRSYLVSYIWHSM